MIIEAGGNHVDLTKAAWRKSTRSGPNCDNCVEVAFVAGVIAIRDSKNPTGPARIFTPTEWGAFVGDTKAGQFDL
jgi:hypothetical protein